MGFLGFANVYAMRVNLSVAIVAMVNNTAIASNSSVIDNSTCPVAANSTEGPPPDGPFAWGANEQGWILGAFFFGYVVTQLPGGRLAEKYGGKRLYGGGILITSIFTLLTPLAATISLPLFVIVRVIEGFGEGVTFPVMHALLAQWIPPNERSRMAGIVYSGAQAGTVLSLPISGLLCDAFGWPSVFYVFGFLGLIWWIGWCYLVYDSPQVHPRISSAERKYILDSLASSKTSSTTLPVPWLKVFTSGPVWALVLVHVAQNYGFYTLLTELPTYMHSVLHFNMKSCPPKHCFSGMSLQLVAVGTSLQSCLGTGTPSVGTASQGCPCSWWPWGPAYNPAWELVRPLSALLLRDVLAVGGRGDQLTILLGNLSALLIWDGDTALLGDLRTVRLEVAVCDLLAYFLGYLLACSSYSVCSWSTTVAT